MPHSIDLAYFGNSGVTFFFILSGFVLTWSFTPSDTAGKFYWRRFARIWPALAVSTAVAIPVFYGLYTKPWDSVNQLGVVASLTMIQSWFPRVVFAGNPAAWSLSDEAFFYLLFPFIIRPLLRARLRTLLVVALGLIGLQLAIRFGSFGLHLTADQNSLAFVSPIGRLAEFVVGMAVAAALRQGWRARIPVSGALTAVALAIVVMWYSRTHLDFLAAAGLGGLLDDAANQILTPLYALLIAAVALRDLSGRHMVLQARPLVLLGQWSYSFYLMHATVLYAVAALWIPRQRPAWSNIWLATMTLGISILAAATVYYLVEHPAERALRRRLKAWPFVTAAAALPAGMAAVVSTTDSAVTAPELSDPVADAEAVITEAAARHAPHRDDQRSDPVGPI